mmetsp:Transcript_26813/g.57795  ORF Transcript_26813/g.57795 Transcript_26813/m.57795 type:complete len:260 (-) Transcript_26813:62-841(-)
MDNATQALESMRAAFSEADGSGLSMDDATFGRYLRARNFNVPKASKMLHETLEWRRSFGLAAMGEWKDIIAVENATGKLYVRGFDLQGRPLLYMKPVRENTRDHEGQIKHLVYNMERAVAAMDAGGQGQTKLNIIIDFDGYSSANSAPLKTSKETLAILQNHYPERLHCAYCLRSPFLVYGFFKVLTPFMDVVTRKKICMLKNNEIGLANGPLKGISRSDLEACAGGADARPFHSPTYLLGPFHLDFNAVLALAEPKQA